MLMITQDHFYIGHLHDAPENPDAIRKPVHHIAKDIECVGWLEIDLFHDGFKPLEVSMDI